MSTGSDKNSSDTRHALRNLAYEIGTRVLERGEYGHDDFSAVLQALQDPAVRAAPGTWLLLKQFQDHWQYLRDEQRGELLVVLEQVFGTAAEWMWSFTVGVLLAECYADDRALRLLQKFVSSSQGDVRTLLPDAFRNLARHAQSDEIRSGARREVERLIDSDDAGIREEARRALRRWP